MKQKKMLMKTTFHWSTFLDNSGSFHMNMISSLMHTIPTEEDSTKWDKDLLGSCQRDETIACEQEEKEEKEEKKLSTMSELETLL